MNIAIILSGGTGTRIGTDIPKQYIEIGGKPIIMYALETIALSYRIDRICVVASSKWQDQLLSWINQNEILSEKRKACADKYIDFALPGLNRQLSIYNGLRAIAEYVSDEDYVFVHDAARPMLTVEAIDSYIDSVQGHDGLIPVLPMKDTVYLSEDGKHITSLLDRKQVFAGQAPELFKYDKYLKANEALINFDTDGITILPTSPIIGINGSTEPAIMSELDIVTIPGDEGNFKITTNNDLIRFKEMIES